jgi:hypothetical protein
VLRSLLREARHRRWWMVQIAPEIPDSEGVRRELKTLGLRRRSDPVWASGRLALTTDEKVLLMGLDGKWRNCMRKGCRLGVSVMHHDGNLTNPDQLVREYLALQQRNNFKGLPETLLRSLAGQTGAGWQFNLFLAKDTNAQEEKEPIGMLVTVRHGDSATYLIGACNDRGRQMQANSVLLWEAILHAKRSGCAWFDIGGLNENTPKGIAKFKKGLNAVPYGLAGEWRWYYRPW